MDYITIDFETANHSLTSACSIGIVGVKNNIIVLEEYYLINPNEEFNDYNVSIHKITAEDVKDADTFDVIWDKIKKYFQNTIIFAHNASFDLCVLKAIIEKYNLDAPNLKFGCTFKISTKLWKEELRNHKLNTLADYLEVEHLHHNALSDAKVCVEIINRGQKMVSASSVNDLYESLGIRFGVYNENRFFSSLNKYQRKKATKVVENNELNDKVIYLCGKPLSISRKQLSEELTNNGVYLEKSVNRSLDYFVALENCPKIKLMLVHELIDNKVPIKIISEKDIINMIK